MGKQEFSLEVKCDFLENSEESRSLVKHDHNSGIRIVNEKGHSVRDRA